MVVHHRLGQPFTGRTLVLINVHSHCAAELSDRFATGNHLRTLVGTRTAGKALGGVNLKLPGGHLLRMPVAHHVDKCRRDSSNTTLSRQYAAQQFAECGYGVRVAGYSGHFPTGAALRGSTAS